jgi:hypothetical protein
MLLGGDMSLVRPQGGGAGCWGGTNAPRFRALGCFLHRELDGLPLLQCLEGHMKHFRAVKKHLAAVFALDEAEPSVFE